MELENLVTGVASSASLLPISPLDGRVPKIQTHVSHASVSPEKDRIALQCRE